MQFDRADRMSKGLDLTPLIDIVFNLLLFFILTTSFIKITALEIGMPSLGATEKTPLKRTERIDISSAGDVFWNGEKIPPALVRERIRSRIGTAKETPILMRAGERVPVQKLVTILDMVYQAGGRQVAVDEWDEADIPAEPVAPVQILDEQEAE